MVSALGGEPPRRPDQMTRHPNAVVAPGGAAGTFRGRLVLVSGSNEGIYVYSGAISAGDLIAAVTSQGGTDPRSGKTVSAGFTAYNTGGVSGGLNMYTGESDEADNGYVASAVENSGKVNQTLSIEGFSPGVTNHAARVSWALISAADDGSTTAEGILYYYDDSLAATAVLGWSNDGVTITVLLLKEQSSAPPTPTGSGTLYVDSAGDLYYLGPSGTSTKLASA